MKLLTSAQNSRSVVVEIDDFHPEKVVDYHFGWTQTRWVRIFGQGVDISKEFQNMKYIVIVKPDNSKVDDGVDITSKIHDMTNTII